METIKKGDVIRHKDTVFVAVKGYKLNGEIHYYDGEDVNTANAYPGNECVPINSALPADDLAEYISIAGHRYHLQRQYRDEGMAIRCDAMPPCQWVLIPYAFSFRSICENFSKAFDGMMVEDTELQVRPQWRGKANADDLE